jgi:hypothetical protein
MQHMTQTPEPRTEPTTVVGQPPPDDRPGRPNRLNQALVWVGIVAGVVFVVALIFFSGFVLGKASGHDGGGHHEYHHSEQMMPGHNGRGGMMGPARQAPPTTTTPAPTTPTP